VRSTEGGVSLTYFPFQVAATTGVSSVGRPAHAELCFLLPVADITPGAPQSPTPELASHSLPRPALPILSHAQPAATPARGQWHPNGTAQAAAGPAGRSGTLTRSSWGGGCRGEWGRVGLGRVVGKGRAAARSAVNTALHSTAPPCIATVCRAAGSKPSPPAAVHHTAGLCWLHLPSTDPRPIV